ncbi:tumor necrosis factor ligand superfamily member 18 isoform X2 [Brachyhypopomus gauderio]|uniref:tumor necrosis factor ligand superfamily member 18 isoform X2 n=1 Tax=Brachyhypopomus gauderio TaxID=698409 RepID=UPI00404138E6
MDGQSCGAHVAQLRRLVWVLLTWASLLTMVLVVSISLHFIIPRASNVTTPQKPPTPTPGTPILYDFGQCNQTVLTWRDVKDDVMVKQDGNYFLYLQVTLESTNKGVDYFIEVIKVISGKKISILEGHINRSQKSTGLIGSGSLTRPGKSGPLETFRLLIILFPPESEKTT